MVPVPDGWDYAFPLTRLNVFIGDKARNRYFKETDGLYHFFKYHEKSVVSDIISIDPINRRVNDILFDMPDPSNNSRYTGELTEDNLRKVADYQISTGKYNRYTIRKEEDVLGTEAFIFTLINDHYKIPLEDGKEEEVTLKRTQIYMLPWKDSSLVPEIICNFTREYNDDACLNYVRKFKVKSDFRMKVDSILRGPLEWLNDAFGDDSFLSSYAWYFLAGDSYPSTLQGCIWKKNHGDEK